MRLANDANCFALSEATDGAAAGAAVVFGVIIGTGTGGGLVVNGRLVAGANAIAGEWGHNPLPSPEDDERPGPPCYCGRSGCIETFLSGPALARDYIALGGDDLSAAEVASRADGGDRRAIECLERYERRFARAIASIINVLDPDVIVLGGGLSNISRLYANIPRLWARARVFRSRRYAARPREARRRQRRPRRRVAVARRTEHPSAERSTCYNRFMKLRFIFGSLAVIWVAGVSHSALQATQAAAPGGSKTVWDGVFSTAQAERGAAAYKTACSECHGNDLAGDGFAPALSGARVHGQLERPERRRSVRAHPHLDAAERTRAA